MNIPVATSWNLTNLLSEEQQKMTGATTTLLSAATGWIAEGDSSRIERTTAFSKWSPASLKLYSSDGLEPVTAKTDTLITGFDQLDEYRGFAWILGHEFKQKVRVGIEWTTVAGSGTTVEYDYTQVEILDTNSWTFVSYTGEPPSSTSKGRLRIDLPEAAEGDLIYIDDAALLRYGNPSGTFLSLLLDNIPAYLRNLDEEQTAPSQPMYRYLQLVAHTANRILAASLAFDYVPPSDAIQYPLFAGYDRSTLVDVSYYPAPDIAEAAWLPWLAFITGTVPIDKISNNVGGSTPWYALMEISPPTSWQDLYDTLADPLPWDAITNPLTWNDIENYLPAPPENTVGLREVIRTKGSGILAGTFEGLRRTARLALSGYDVPATVTRLNNVATIEVLVHQTGAASGNTVNIYDDVDTTFNGEYTLLSVGSTGETFTVTSIGENISTPVPIYITNKVVTVERVGQWGLLVKTLDAQTDSLQAVLDAATFAKPAGCVLTNELL